MKILILGITGMLGSILFNEYSKRRDLFVFGTTRNNLPPSCFNFLDSKIIRNIHADNINDIENLCKLIKPDLVINCIGLIKQLSLSNKTLQAISINSLLPHQLVQISKIVGSKFLHISTDCVFDGKRGNYSEEDPSDAVDLYGRTKFLGEVADLNGITLRTSIVGHELNSKYGLLEWFLSQSNVINGYTNAIFSGLTTYELSKVIIDYVVPAWDSLNGLYHVASEPISKFELLKLFQATYEKEILIKEQNSFVINRSLNAKKFNSLVNYCPPCWSDMVKLMKINRISNE